MPVAQKLGAEIRRHAFSVSEAANLKITASIGVASFDGHPDYAYPDRAGRQGAVPRQAGRTRPGRRGLSGGGRRAWAAVGPRPWRPRCSGARRMSDRTMQNPGRSWIGNPASGEFVFRLHHPGLSRDAALDALFAAQRLDQLGHQQPSSPVISIMSESNFSSSFAAMASCLP